MGEEDTLRTAATTDNPSLSLVSLYEISKLLTASVDLHASLRAVLNLMSSYLEMRRGVVAIVADANSLDIVAAAGPPQDGRGGETLALPAQVARSILKGEMPFVTEDVAEHPLLADYVAPSGALDDERVSFIGVPIKTVGRPFGVLAIARVWNEAT